MKTNGKPINWDNVRSRLAQSQLALERALVADPQRIEDVYRQRAAQLARPRARSVTTAGESYVQVFLLGTQRYALEIAELAEVMPLVKYTPVPGAAPEFLGVINLRGDIRPVVDLSGLLGLTNERIAAPGYLLLLRKQPVGLRVDGLEHIQLIRPKDLCVPNGAEPSARYSQGVTLDKLIVLRGEALLAHNLLTTKL